MLSICFCCTTMFGYIGKIISCSVNPQTNKVQTLLWNQPLPWPDPLSPWTDLDHNRILIFSQPYFNDTSSRQMVRDVVGSWDRVYSHLVWRWGKVRFNVFFTIRRPNSHMVTNFNYINRVENLDLLSINIIQRGLFKEKTCIVYTILFILTVLLRNLSKSAYNPHNHV